MSGITLKFNAFVIGTEGIATDDEGDFLAGEVDFDAVVDGTLHRGLVARVKQAAGSTFADPLEVEWPERFEATFRYGAFRDCVDEYVRHQISERILGARGRLNRNVRLDHVRLAGDFACELAAGPS